MARKLSMLFDLKHYFQKLQKNVKRDDYTDYHGME